MLNSTRAIVILAFIALLLAGCSLVRPDAEQRIESGDYTKKADSNRKVVVFIHGVFGDKDSTWRNGKTKAYWPELFGKDPDLNGFDVYVAGYYSPMLGVSSNLEQLSNRMLDQLERKGALDYDQVYFVAHSMGGLVAKRMLIKLNTPGNVSKLRHVAALITLSTPSRGATLAEIGSFLSSNPQLKDMTPFDMNTFLQSVEADWNSLLIERDKLNGLFPRAFCAYETQPLSGVTIVVSNFYAATRCDENPYALDLDHLEIVKPATSKSDQYTWVKARIAAVARMKSPVISEEASITKSNIVEILIELGFTDVHIATEMHWIVDALMQNGITTKAQLRGVREDRYVIAKLKQIYIEELKRREDFPLDAVAVAMYGSYLWKHASSDEAVLAIRNAIRTSVEYKKVHGL